MHKKKCTQTGRTPTFSKEFRLYFRILEFDILLIVVVKSPRIGKKCPCLWTTRTQNYSVVSLDPSKAFNTFYHSLHSLTNSRNTLPHWNRWNYHTAILRFNNFIWTYCPTGLDTNWTESHTTKGESHSGKTSMCTVLWQRNRVHRCGSENEHSIMTAVVVTVLRQRCAH